MGNLVSFCCDLEEHLTLPLTILALLPCKTVFSQLLDAGQCFIFQALDFTSFKVYHCCTTGTRCDWCFMCELQKHVQKVRASQSPFAPINILSQIQKIGSHLGYGRQEDAHEFMR